MTARKRRTRKTARAKTGKFIAIWALILVLALAVATAIALVGMMRSWLQDLPDYSDHDAYVLSESTTILDLDGNVIAEFYMDNRIPLTSLDQCSTYVIQGTVDTEDERFYTHNGIDIRGIARAVVVQLLGGSEGASTITQQLVRNTVLSDEQFEMTLRRKVREAYVSMELEKIYSKDEILLMYLNSIYYGNGCYGIEAAAQTYFGKTCTDLTISEAATLVGLPQSPSMYDPTINPDSALERRNVVLGKLLDAGHISQAEYDEAIVEPIELNVVYRTSSGARKYPYFVDYVKSQLQNQFSTEIIYKGGLTVKTTISPWFQDRADAAVQAFVGDTTDGLEAALVAINPWNGYIYAMVGGRDYNTDQFNLATMARRQPGSSFKTFTLVAAIQAGMRSDLLISGASPITIGDWTINNYNYQSYGNLSLAQATWLSCNTVFAQVINEIGAQSVADVAHAMGITSDLDVYNSLTLGASGCSVLEMASAYGTLATGGVHYEPVAIIEVDDRDGNPLYVYEPVGTQAISAEVAYATTKVLEGVLSGDSSSCTGVEARLGVDQPVAGKTGTTEDVRDLWFCGYTPQLTCAVWVGYRTEKTIYYNGSRGTTHMLPSPLWSTFMTSVLQGVDRGEWVYAGDPIYRSNSSWSIGRGTYVPYVPTVITETDDTTDAGTTVTEGDAAA